jgi:hypothetical protein
MSYVRLKLQQRSMRSLTNLLLSESGQEQAETIYSRRAQGCLKGGASRIVCSVYFVVYSSLARNAQSAVSALFSQKGASCIRLVLKQQLALVACLQTNHKNT